MLGPTCKVDLPAPVNSGVLDNVDYYLRREGKVVQHEQEGRAWNVEVEGRFFKINAAAVQSIRFEAGLNSPADYAILQRISDDVARMFDGILSGPEQP